MTLQEIRKYLTELKVYSDRMDEKLQYINKRIHDLEEVVMDLEDEQLDKLLSNNLSYNAN